MATSILEKVDIKKTAKNIKKTAANLNKETMNVSEDIVEGAITVGNEWTKVMEKAAKNGTILFGKQQDIVLDTLEEIKAQYFTGSSRFGKLIGFPTFTKRFRKAAQDVTETAKAKMTETRQTIDEVLENAMENDIIKSVSKKANEVVATTTKTAKKTAKKAKATKAKATMPKAKAAVKTAKEKVVKATAKSDVKADDLKLIEGIGPKMASILNDAGIKTFTQLANTKVSTVKEILAAAGPRYNMHNPATWGKQAKLAAAGRMAELKKLKAELKGGKVAKK